MSGCDILFLDDEQIDWIRIPGKGYSIAKYPITNAQYAKFIEAGGYCNERWWTKQGWAKREAGEWIEPLFWWDNRWNDAEQPVVGVSWYECVAYSLWLTALACRQIMLPTEDQWQYAAQGDDGRIYPWGKKWDTSRYNNNIDGKGIGKTTPVHQFQGKGDSPFGVVDMAGNVWEWCLTDYENRMNDVHGDAAGRVLRGGSWISNLTGLFRADCRNYKCPHVRNSYFGFRVVRFD